MPLRLHDLGAAMIRESDVRDELDGVPTDEPEPAPRRPRGFAAIDPARRAEISSKGGKAAHKLGTAHKFTPAEASLAGKKGGRAPHVRRGRARREGDPA